MGSDDPSAAFFVVCPHYTRLSPRMQAEIVNFRFFGVEICQPILGTTHGVRQRARGKRSIMEAWEFKLQFIGLKPDKLLMNNEVAASG
jgi:hypothetical protein